MAWRQIFMAVDDEDDRVDVLAPDDGDSVLLRLNEDEGLTVELGPDDVDDLIKALTNWKEERA